MGHIELAATGLFSKWGFSDGDILDGVLSKGGYCVISRPIDKHLSFDHEVLARCVERYLLPALPVQIEVYRIATCHNPIRIADSSVGLLEVVEDVTVRVSAESILEIAAEVLREYQASA